MEKSPTLSQHVRAVQDQIIDLIEEDPKLSNRMYILRWLRASQFNVERAVKAIRENRKWRRENHVDKMSSEKPDANFANKFPYFYDVKGKASGRPVAYFHVDIMEYGCLAKEFEKGEILRQLVHHMVWVEKAVMDWDNEWNGPLEDLPAERTKGIFFIVDAENLGLKKAMYAPALKFCLEWTRLYAKYFPTMGRECHMINAPGFVHISSKLFQPIIATVGASLYVYPGGKGAMENDDLQREVFSVISPKQLEELHARAKAVEEYRRGG